MKELKRLEWHGWTIRKLEQPYSSKPRWRATRNCKTGGIDEIEKGKLGTVKACIALVDRHGATCET